MDWKSILVRIYYVVRDTFLIWGNTKASRMSAALSYYTMLSLAPILVIAVAIAGWFYGEQLAQSELLTSVADFTSPAVAETIQGLINNASRPQSGLIAGTISLLIILFGASGVFSQLHDTFNVIWGVPLQTRSGIKYALQQRLLGIFMVLILGLLLILSMLMGTIISAVSDLIAETIPWAVNWLSYGERLVSFLLLPLVFSVMFWGLPHTKIKWFDMLLPGLFTAVLMLFGRNLIILYLSFSTTSAVYGAAGSLVILLVWVYLTGMIVFLGAASGRAYVTHFRKKDYPDLAPISEDF